MREKLSALVDGELSSEESQRLLDTVNRDESCRRDWDLYCLIGDTLRGDLRDQSGILARVRKQIEFEPTVLSPIKLPEKRSIKKYIMPLAASLAGLVVVAWTALSIDNDISSEVVATTTPPLSSSIHIPTETAGMQTYLIAHRAHSPTSNIQGATLYMRGVIENREPGRR